MSVYFEIKVCSGLWGVSSIGELTGKLVGRENYVGEKEKILNVLATFSTKS